jgi:hypothetical protein
MTKQKKTLSLVLPCIHHLICWNRTLSVPIRMANLYICVVLTSCNTEGIVALVLSFLYTILKNMIDSF